MQSSSKSSDTTSEKITDRFFDTRLFDRLEGGSWPVNIMSRNVSRGGSDVADIVNKVEAAKKSMRVLDGLQLEISKLAKEVRDYPLTSTVSMFAIMRAGHVEDTSTLRRRKAELEEEVDTDRLCITAEDMLRLRSKLSIVQNENTYLRKQLNKNEAPFDHKKHRASRVAGGNEDTTDEDSKALKVCNSTANVTQVERPTSAQSCESDDSSNSSSDCDERKGAMWSLSKIFFSLIFCGREPFKRD